MHRDTLVDTRVAKPMRLVPGEKIIAIYQPVHSRITNPLIPTLQYKEYLQATFEEEVQLCKDVRRMPSTLLQKSMLRYYHALLRIMVELCNVVRRVATSEHALSTAVADLKECIASKRQKSALVNDLDVNSPAPTFWYASSTAHTTLIMTFVDTAASVVLQQRGDGEGKQNGPVADKVPTIEQLTKVIDGTASLRLALLKCSLLQIPLGTYTQVPRWMMLVTLCLRSPTPFKQSPTAQCCALLCGIIRDNRVRQRPFVSM